MEFTCVLPVNGSLVSYHLRRKGNVYEAKLKSGGKGKDIPAFITLQKAEGKWTGEPWQEEIVTGLGNAIDAAV